MHVVKSARLRRHLASSTSPDGETVITSRYSSASRLLENARFIEQGHLDTLIKSTMKNVEKILRHSSNTNNN